MRCRLQTLFVQCFVRGSGPGNTRRSALIWAAHSALALISVMTMLRVRYRRNVRIGHLLIDISHRGETYDFRSVPFMEFVPPTHSANFLHVFDLRHALRTCLTKSHPVYFESLHTFWHLLPRSDCPVALAADFDGLDSDIVEELDRIRAVHERWTGDSRSKRRMLRRVIRFMRLDQFVMIDDARNANEFKLACRDERVRTVAYMHARFNEYDVGQFQFPPDIYLVWSDYFRRSFVEQCPEMAAENVVVTGHPRLATLPAPVQRSKSPLTVIFVGESHTSNEEVFPYIDALVAEDGFHVLFRPKSDQQREALAAHLGERELQIAKPLPFLEMLHHEHADVMVGTYSTTLLESWLVGVPSVMARTSHDYSVNLAEEGHTILCESPEEIAFAVRRAAAIDACELTEIRDGIWGRDPSFKPKTVARCLRV